MPLAAALPFVSAGLGALGNLFGGASKRKAEQAAADREDYFKRLGLFQQDKQFGARQGLDQNTANVDAQGGLLRERRSLDDRALSDRNTNALLPIRRKLANQVAARFGADPIDFDRFAPVRRTANIGGLEGAVNRVGAAPAYQGMAAPVDPATLPRKKGGGLLRTLGGIFGGAAGALGAAGAAGAFGGGPKPGAGVGGGFQGYPPLQRPQQGIGGGFRGY